MVTSELLNRVRTLLDESSSGFWEDSEIYEWLTDGQNQIVNEAGRVFLESNRKFLPKILLSVSKERTAATGGSLALPSDYKLLIIAKYAQVSTEEKRKCIIKDYSEYLAEEDQNLFTQATKIQPIVYERHNSSGTKTLEFRPIGSGAYYIFYVYEPTAITASVNPLIPDFTKETLVQYAYARGLQKDENPIANAELSKFYEMLPRLMV